MTACHHAGTMKIQLNKEPLVKKGTKQLTEKEFRDIKTLISVGVKPGQIRSITGRSLFVVGGAARFDTLEEFRKFNTESRRQYKGGHKLTAQVETPIEPGNQVLINLTDAIVGMTEQWKSMEDKLDEVLETKRPWFNKAR